MPYRRTRTPWSPETHLHSPRTCQTVWAKPTFWTFLGSSLWVWKVLSLMPAQIDQWGQWRTIFAMSSPYGAKITWPIILPRVRLHPRIAPHCALHDCSSMAPQRIQRLPGHNWLTTTESAFTSYPIFIARWPTSSETDWVVTCHTIVQIFVDMSSQLF